MSKQPDDKIIMGDKKYRVIHHDDGSTTTVEDPDLSYQLYDNSDFEYIDDGSGPTVMWLFLSLLALFAIIPIIYIFRNNDFGGFIALGVDIVILILCFRKYKSEFDKWNGKD